MHTESITGQLHRWLLVLAVGVSAVIVGPRGGLDGVGVGKTAAVSLAAIVACAATAIAGVRERAFTVAIHPAVWTAVAFGTLMIVRASMSDRVGLALNGPLGRANGAVLYAAAVALFVVAVARSDAPTWSLFARVMVVAAAIVALAAIDERTLRLGPNWVDRPGVAGTLGNANFLASWGGIVLPLTLAVAADGRRHRYWRLAATGSAVLLAVAVVLSGSLQGGFVVAATLTVLGLVWASERLPAARWRRLAVVTGVAASAAGALTVLGALGVGPLAALGQQVGVRLRRAYWGAAVEMISDAPLLGVDPGAYIDHYRASRPAGAAAVVDLTSSSDSAHNVALHLAAEGGILVALLWTAVMVLVTWSLWRGLLSRRGQDRLLLGSIGAAWVGYLLQSLISIDVAPLVAMGWVLAGFIVGASGVRVWRVGRPQVTTRGRRAGSVVRQPRASAPQYAACAGIVVLASVAAWGATQAYRADAASARAEIERSRTPEGPSASTPAAELAPYESRYLVQLVERLGEAGEVDRVGPVVDRAIEVNPRSFEAHLNAARLAVAEEEFEAAAAHYARARELDPYHPDLAVEYAAVLDEVGDTDRARQLREEALAVDPDHEEAQRLLEER